MAPPRLSGCAAAGPLGRPLNAVCDRSGESFWTRCWRGATVRIPAMKKLLALLAVFSAAAAFAADQVPLFNGTLAIGHETRFLLVSPAGKTSPWLKIGDTFEGYAVKAYDAKAAALDLEREGKTMRVGLVADAAVANAPAAPTPATLADAEEVFRVMRFDEMMKKVLEGQKKAMGPMMQQAMAQGLARAKMNLSDEDKAAYAAMQAKLLDQTLGAITGPEMRAAMAQIYSDVFSKEELNSMAAFYGTPGGQALIDKQPEVQQKMMGVMMPLIMQNQQAAQQQMGNFMSGLKAKYSAPGAAAAAPAPAAKP